MGKYAASDPIEITTEAVEKALDSFKELSDRLYSDFQQCIELAKNLNAHQQDENFENFYKQFEPQQEDIRKLKEQMDRQINFVDSMKQDLIDYLIVGKKQI